jgi:metal-sulfur cluster biosynthetic enzyme
MLTEDAIRAALRDCYDPVIPCNVVDLGLLRSVEIQLDSEAPGAGIAGVPEKHRVTIALTPTVFDEAGEAQLSAQVANRLAGFETISHTTVTLLHTPPWSPLEITPAGRKTLGLDGNPTLVQIR